MIDNRVMILHNIISPYKTLIFNKLYQQYEDMKVVYISETEAIREWHIDREELHFPHDIMFSGSLENVKQFRAAIRTWKTLQKFNPDIVIIGGYNYVSYLIGFCWAKFKGKRIILWSASNNEDRSRYFLKEKLKSYIVRKFDAANVYGSKSRDYLLKLGIEPRRVFIKGNSTDNKFYSAGTMRHRVCKRRLCREAGLPENNFLFIGRFSQEKNILSLLEAYEKLLTNSITSWGLILVGNGPQRLEIEKYIERHDLKNVHLPGFKQRDDVVRYLAMSDVFILPSISEPWGLVVNEAMASGLPVIVSKNCGCYPDLIKEGANGFSFDPYDIDELSRLMMEFVNGNCDIRGMREQSTEIIKEYTPENAARVLLETIKFVMNQEQ